MGLKPSVRNGNVNSHENERKVVVSHLKIIKNKKNCIVVCSLHKLLRVYPSALLNLSNFFLYFIL